MDPKACLEEIRLLTERYYAMGGIGLTDEDENRLVDLIESLDQWLTNGGFSPWED